MKIKVFDSESNSFLEKESIGKVKYIGESFGVDSLTNGNIYEYLEILDKDYIRVIDDSGEDYLYFLVNPAPLDGSSKGGKWEFVEKY
ncbi:MAG: hypothetical protein PHQ32_02440 [Firmicutes bacterium]|nr:hypothetical protein [Bacillota bacterium]